jgi:molecular chaperone GrpE
VAGTGGSVSDGEADGSSKESKSRRRASSQESPGSADEVAPAERSPAAEEELLSYQRQARLAQDRLTEVLDAYRQLKIENERFRERVTRSIEHQFDRRRERLLVRFIDILDNFDRALDAAEQSYAGNPLIDGLILVRTQLLNILKEEGLERIPVLGLPFDPNVSEAMGTEPVQDPDNHHVVVKEPLRGYRLNGRIARASRVVIGEYRADGTEAIANPVPPAEERPAEAPSPRVDAQEEFEEQEMSLEEIVARAEAQEALFPRFFGEAESAPPTPSASTPGEAED